MPGSILAALVPESALKKARRLWTALLLLSPAAMALGIWLMVRTEPKPPVRVTVSRASVEGIARDFAAQKGITTTNWNVSIDGHTDDTERKFANKSKGRRDIWRYAPPVYAMVALTPTKPDQFASATVSVGTGGSNVELVPKSKTAVMVDITLDGRVFGYDFTGIWRPGPRVSDAEALRIARAQLPAGLSFGDPAITPTNTGREFSFHAAPMEEFDITANVRVEGARATKLQLSAAPVQGMPASDSDPEDIIVIVAVIFAFAMAAFSIYRYAVRSMQGEISHARSLLVAALCAAFFMLFEGDIVHAASGTTSLIIWLVLIVLSIFAGGLLAIAYGSGEGDVREGWPGKLTSLDALLTGRVWTRNVGASVLTGFAWAGWCIFAIAILSLPFRHPGAIHASRTLTAPLIRFPLLVGLVSYPLIAILYAAAGLMQPLAFLYLYARRLRRWWIPILAVCAALAASVRTSDVNFPQYLILTIVMAAGLLIPFFTRDLLASLVCVGANIAGVAFAPDVVSLPHQQSTMLHVPLAIGVVVFALLALRYGHTVTEEEVRPLYARHIAERKSLEAEVSAAREAQLRLLPSGVPDWRGLSISASCVPAEIVGGDFYDFFDLSDGRLGVFMAEGNNRGLAAALKIALAKGYLMQAVQKTAEPVEILARLESALAQMLANPDPRDTGFAFASIDKTLGALRYARTGDYPRVVISSSRTAVGETLGHVKGRATPLIQGSAELSPGDSILLFTDGIGRKLSATGREDSDSKLTAMATADVDAAALSRRVLAESKYEDAPDDLTLVVIRVETVGASALEVVA